MIPLQFSSDIICMITTSNNGHHAKRDHLHSHATVDNVYRRAMICHHVANANHHEVSAMIYLFHSHLFPWMKVFASKPCKRESGWSQGAAGEVEMIPIKAIRCGTNKIEAADTFTVRKFHMRHRKVVIRRLLELLSCW